MYDLFFRYPFMSTQGIAACDARAFVGAMCRFECALARIEEEAGHLPRGSAERIAEQVKPEGFDIDALACAVADGGNVAIPFVKQARALLPCERQAMLHKGATSQDVIDSALMLVLKPRLCRCLLLLADTRSHGARLMRAHTDTPMIGRTLTQQALPLTFGAKVAQWLAGLIQAERRLAAVVENGLFVQFGGPVGTQHGLDDGMDLMAALAAELDLACPMLPWHTDRQPVLAIIDAVGGVAVAAEKIATDVAFMAQSEIGEASEPAATGDGGSSSMPHKSNPIGSVRIRSAARQIHASVGLVHNAGAQVQERAFGEWHAEWAPLIDAVLLLEGALETLASLLDGLQINSKAMRRNLALAGGANLAAPTVAFLSQFMAGARAKTLAAQAAETAREKQLDYADALLAIPEIGEVVAADRLRAAVDPAAYIGTSRAQIARVESAMARL